MNIVSELEKILESEQQMLLSGNFAGLQSLVERKAKLAEQLDRMASDVPKDTVEQLSRKAKHNEALLDSARLGLQAAMAQIKQLSDGESQKTYSKEGHRKTLARKPVSIVQKC